MEITFKVKFNDYKYEHNSLTEIIDESVYHKINQNLWETKYVNTGELEKIKIKLNNTIKLTESLIEILHKKSILNDDDIKTIVSKFFYLGIEDESFIIHNKE